MEGSGFQEPRLVLYSPSPKKSEVVAATKAPPPLLTVQQLRTRRKSAIIRNGFEVSKAGVRGAAAADPIGVAAVTLPSSSYNDHHPPVPTDIIVGNAKGMKASSSSEQSVVSEITQPLVLMAALPAKMGKNSNENSRDISEMRQRLEAIKERRARIKGRQLSDIPSVVIRNQQPKSSKMPEQIMLNPQQSYRERQAEKEAMQLPLQQQQTQVPPQRKPSFVRQRSSLDPPEQTDPVVVAVDDATEEAKNAEPTPPVIASPRDIAAPEPALVLPSATTPNQSTAPPATPPRNLGSELRDFKSSMSPSLSPKSAGVSTCHTFDETMEGSYDDSFHNRNNAASPWTLRRLICKTPNMTMQQRSRERGIDTGFGQIRASRSLDYFGSKTGARKVEEPPLFSSANIDGTRKGRRPSRVSRRSTTFDDACAATSQPKEEKESGAFGEEVVDNIQDIDADGFLIGRAALRHGKFTEYPRPPLPGKAYSEIVSEKSSLGPDELDHARSCLRRDPWYMTRRMKQQQQQQARDLETVNEKKGVMHTVVFVNQKSRK